MKLLEITVENLDFQTSLNPRLWDGSNLKPEVRDQLTLISDEFIEYLDLPDAAIQDVIITGSSCGYNWTKQSDIDLHVILDMEELRDSCPDYIDEYFKAKRLTWNSNHIITIYGHEVECYPQDQDEPHFSSGQFSVTNNQWLKVPSRTAPNIDASEVLSKYQAKSQKIEELIKTHCSDISAVKKMIDSMKKYRQAGLERAGEFSVENLVFKELRRAGWIDQLYTCYRDAFSQNLSLEG